MELHPLIVTYTSEPLAEKVDVGMPRPKTGEEAETYMEKLRDKVRQFNVWPYMFDRRLKYNPHLFGDCFVPLGRVDLPYTGGRVHLKRLGHLIVGQRKETLPQVLIGKTPSGWAWMDDTVDEHTESLTDEDLTLLCELLRSSPMPLPWLVEELENEPNQHWGYLEFPLQTGSDQLFRPNPTQLMAKYNRLEYEHQGMILLELWERLYAGYQHHITRAVENDLLYNFNPVPIYFLTQPEMYYRQALVFGLRWFGYEKFTRLITDDPRLVFLSVYWAVVFIQSHAFQYELNQYPASGGAWIDHLFYVTADYFAKRRGVRLSPVDLRSDAVNDDTVNFTPISPMLETYFVEVLDRLQFEEFSR